MNEDTQDLFARDKKQGYNLNNSNILRGSKDHQSIKIQENSLLNKLGHIKSEALK